MTNATGLPFVGVCRCRKRIQAAPSDPVRTAFEPEEITGRLDLPHLTYVIDVFRAEGRRSDQ